MIRILRSRLALARLVALAAIAPMAAGAAMTITVHASGTVSGRQIRLGDVSDATGALPWALGLVLAGAGLIGARALRRRHAQR